MLIQKWRPGGGLLFRSIPRDRRPRHALTARALASLAVQTLLMACLVGVIDLVIFEPAARRVAFTEWVLYKPSFLSVSPFLAQQLSFCAVAFGFFLICVCLSKVVERLLHRSLDSLVPSMSNLLVVLFIAGARWYRFPEQIHHIAVFVIASFAAIFVGLFLVRLCHRNLTAKSPSHGMFFLSAEHAFAIVILFPFFLPDVYSIYRRFSFDQEPSRPSLPSVLLIVMDTVRADHLSCYGYRRSPTPNIDRLASEGALFANAYSTAPWTLPSHASMFTALYPSQHQADWPQLLLEDSFVTLAERLRDRGYRTAGFTENAMITRAHGFAQGFEEYHETWKRPVLVRAARRLARGLLHLHETRDHSDRTLRLLKRWILNNSDSPKPSFTFVNLMAAHLPNYPRADMQRFSPIDLAKIEPVNLIPEKFYLQEYNLNAHELAIMSDLYDGEIRRLDSQIGKLLSFLDEKRILDKLVVIVTSDHGENFGDHGYIEHQYCLYNTLIKVPLIIRFPTKISPGIVTENVSTVHLLDTIMSLLELHHDIESDPVSNSLLSMPVPEVPVYAEHGNLVDWMRPLVVDDEPDFDFTRFDASFKCIVTGGFKFIWSSNGRNELYNISEDPLELENLIERKPDVAFRLSEALDDWLVPIGPPAPAAQRPNVDQETHEELRALGYVQ